MKRKLITIVLFISVIANVLAVFQSRRSAFLKYASCPPPCWNSIYPGRSTQAEVMGRLSQLPEIDQGSVGSKKGDILFSPMDSYVYWAYTPKVSDIRGSIYLSEDRVAIIELDTGGSLTLAEAVDKLGTPEQVYAQAGCGPDGNRSLTVYLLFPSRGAVVAYYKSSWARNDRVNIWLGNSITEVIYFAASSYEKFVIPMTLMRFSSRLSTTDYSVARDKLEAWRGFYFASYSIEDLCQL